MGTTCVLVTDRIVVNVAEDKVKKSVRRIQSESHGRQIYILATDMTAW